MVDWKDKKVVIIGAARQGTALARYLCMQGALVIMTDLRSFDDLHAAREMLDGFPVEWVLGEHPSSLLEGTDYLCPSGGVPLTLPLLVEAKKRGIPITNDSQIFLDNVFCRVIGITGSAGKTTTTTLVGRIAEEDRKSDRFTGKVFVGGNIGNPLISLLDQITDKDLVVMELSSFQLEIMTRSPQIAAILNITPNHLDRHGTMTAYTWAKAQILEHQDGNDIAVLNRDDPITWSLRDKVKGKMYTFGLSKLPANEEGTYLDESNIMVKKGGDSFPLFSTDEIALRGKHNLLNVLAACAISAAIGIPATSMHHGVKDFRGVDHRLQFVRHWGGADWYNDSIATAPERVIAAVQSFDEPLVLLVGGRDKDLPWDEFAHIIRRRVDHLVVFGEASEKIVTSIQASENDPDGRLQTIETYPSLFPAVQAAAALVNPGDIVLLSPGGTSFDEFQDFEERGLCFVKWVNELR